MRLTCVEAFDGRRLILVSAAAARSFLRQQKGLQAGDHHRQEGFGPQRRRGLLGPGWFVWTDALGLSEEYVGASAAAV